VRIFAQRVLFKSDALQYLRSLLPPNIGTEHRFVDSQRLFDASRERSDSTLDSKEKIEIPEHKSWNLHKEHLSSQRKPF